MSDNQFLRLYRPLPDALSDNQISRRSLVFLAEMFNEIALPFIYTEIVTDDALVLLNFDLPSERNRFSYTRRLFIEFSGKNQEPGYTEILPQGKSAWKELGSMDRVIVECEQEIYELAGCWRRAKEVGMGVGMPRLETVSIGSIYGGEEGTWRLYEDVYRVNKQRYPHMPDLAECQANFMLFLGSGNLRELCSRDTMGPMSIASIAVPPGSPYGLTVHSPREPYFLPLPIGRPIRYTFDSPSPSDDWNPTLLYLDQALGKLSVIRKRQLESGRLRREQRHCVDIEIFCSTNHYRAGRDDPALQVYGVSNEYDAAVNPLPLTGEQQATIAKAMGAALQAFLRRDSGLADVVRWGPSGEQPIRACCGTGPPA